jgi:hypothetical protein
MSAWVRFIDEMGERIGDREMFEVPSVGDSICLAVVKKFVVPDSGGKEGGSLTTSEFRIGRRLWIPDYYPNADEKIVAVVVLEKK